MVTRMVVAYLDVWITLQNHPETHVQRGLATSLLFALQAVPSLALVDEILNYMPELRRWLDVCPGGVPGGRRWRSSCSSHCTPIPRMLPQATASENPDPATREFAKMTLAVVGQKLQQMLPPAQ